VSDSDLQVPFAFTPNGDGKNDEFRVAYRSLATFKCWIFNRWGKQIYFWTDPQKGWDGNIGRRPASTGGYMYVIEAVGTDGKKFKKKGIVNLLRGKE
jgi:gliding motility-associated-like protein